MIDETNQPKTAQPRVPAVYVCRATEAQFLHTPGKRHSDGHLVVRVDNGKPIHSGKVKFYKERPIDPRLFNVIPLYDASNAPWNSAACSDIGSIYDSDSDAIPSTADVTAPDTDTLGELTSYIMGESLLLPTTSINDVPTPTESSGTTHVGVPRLVQRRTAIEMLSGPLFNVDLNAGDDDSPLNTHHRVPPPPNEIYSTLFRHSGQSITENNPHQGYFAP